MSRRSPWRPGSGLERAMATAALCEPAAAGGGAGADRQRACCHMSGGDAQLLDQPLAAAVGALRRLASADQQFELAVALLAGILVQRHVRLLWWWHLAPPRPWGADPASSEWMARAVGGMMSATFRDRLRRGWLQKGSDQRISRDSVFYRAAGDFKRRLRGRRCCWRAQEDRVWVASSLREIIS